MAVWFANERERKRQKKWKRNSELCWNIISTLEEKDPLTRLLSIYMWSLRLHTFIPHPRETGKKSFFSAGVSNYDREKLMIVDFINLFKFHFPPQEELQYKFEECERRRHMEQRRKEEDKKSGAREVSKTIYGEVEKQHKKKNCCVCDLVSRVELWPWNLLENFNLLVNELKRSFS